MRPEAYRHIILALWLAWALYWLISALSNKATARRESLASRLSYVLPALVAAVLIGGRHFHWAWLDARLWPSSSAPDPMPTCATRSTPA